MKASGLISLRSHRIHARKQCSSMGDDAQTVHFVVVHRLSSHKFRRSNDIVFSAFSRPSARGLSRKNIAVTWCYNSDRDLTYFGSTRIGGTHKLLLTGRW